MSVKHAPGPWVYLPSDDIPGMLQKYHVVGSLEVGGVCTVYWQSPAGTTRATARLIAAAPDLLDALVQATAALHAMALRTGAPRDQAQAEAVESLRSVIHAGQAAIDKATKEFKNG